MVVSLGFFIYGSYKTFLETPQGTASFFDIMGGASMSTCFVISASLALAGYSFERSGNRSAYRWIIGAGLLHVLLMCLLLGIFFFAEGFAVATTVLGLDQNSLSPRQLHRIADNTSLQFGPYITLGISIGTCAYGVLAAFVAKEDSKQAMQIAQDDNEAGES